MLFNQLIFLKQKQFTGKVNLKSSQNINWTFYLYLGRLVWIDGGIHPNRSWKRLLDKYRLNSNININKIEIGNLSKFQDQSHYILTILLKNKLIKREEATEIIRIKAQEALFELLQLKQKLKIVSVPVSPSTFFSLDLSPSVNLLNIEDVLQDAQQKWLVWKHKKLEQWSPNYAPILKSPEQLQEEVSGVVFQNFLLLLDGQRTIADLAVRMNKDVIRLTSSLRNYVNQGLLDFVEVEDIEPPKILQKIFSTAKNSQVYDSNQPLIVCIDDSPQICKVMEQIITNAGYRFIPIQESITAIPTLLTNNPDFIFLDIGMPIANGYEICTQIRRISQLKNIPIVILTGNDGIVDRVRAKVAGATAFISKPIEIEKIIDSINKFMQSNLDRNKVTDSVLTKNKESNLNIA